MDPLLAVILTRAMERLLVVVAGIVSIYVGYRLFLNMPTLKESEGRLSLPGGVSFFASRIGPGVFFALFGASLIGYSATRPVSLTAPELVASAEGLAGASYTGFGTRAAAGKSLPPGSADRSLVVTFLNKWLADTPSDAPSDTKIDRRIAATESKLALMREIWDETKWGAYDSFHQWVTVSAGTGPPPEGNADAATFFKASSP
jgi:branched-subunit amino acid transport protein